MSQEYSFSAKIGKGRYTYQGLVGDHNVRFSLINSLDKEEMSEFRAVVERTHIEKFSVDDVSFFDQKAVVTLNEDN